MVKKRSTWRGENAFPLRLSRPTLTFNTRLCASRLQMQTKLKIIATTAVGTTLFWVAVIGLLFLSGRQPDRIEVQFMASDGALGIFYGRNTKTNNVVLVVEELPLNTNATGSVELLRREVAPQQGLRVGIREFVQKSD